jgi:hypothetical protein
MDDSAPAAIHNSKGEFAVEPDTEPGNVPAGVINELRNLRTAANEASTDFREAINTQADKHKVKRAALRRYIIALGNDKVDEAAKEATDLERLIETGATA